MLVRYANIQVCLARRSRRPVGAMPGGPWILRTSNTRVARRTTEARMSVEMARRQGPSSGVEGQFGMACECPASGRWRSCAESRANSLPEQLVLEFGPSDRPWYRAPPAGAKASPSLRENAAPCFGGLGRSNRSALALPRSPARSAGGLAPSPPACAAIGPATAVGRAGGISHVDILSFADALDEPVDPIGPAPWPASTCRTETTRIDMTIAA